MLGTSGFAIAGFTHTAVATTNASHTHLPSQMDHFKIRGEIGRFRILIVGRANAGKTTILQRVCNMRGIPEIYDSGGQKVCLMILARGW
jgi:GTP-binding protein EngB required for normal cell division